MPTPFGDVPLRTPISEPLSNVNKAHQIILPAAASRLKGAAGETSPASPASPSTRITVDPFRRVGRVKKGSGGRSWFRSDLLKGRACMPIKMPCVRSIPCTGGLPGAAATFLTHTPTDVITSKYISAHRPVGISRPSRFAYPRAVAQTPVHLIDGLLFSRTERSFMRYINPKTPRTPLLTRKRFTHRLTK